MLFESDSSQWPDQGTKISIKIWNLFIIETVTEMMDRSVFDWWYLLAIQLAKSRSQLLVHPFSPWKVAEHFSFSMIFFLVIFFSSFYTHKTFEKTFYYVKRFSFSQQGGKRPAPLASTWSQFRMVKLLIGNEPETDMSWFQCLGVLETDGKKSNTRKKRKGKT